MSNHGETLEHDHSSGHVHRDDTGSKMGMWLFLFTEVLLFGGMFIMYAGYRYEYPEAFVAAALRLDPILGAINTVILLTSSLTVVLGIVALEIDPARRQSGEIRVGGGHHERPARDDSL